MFSSSRNRHTPTFDQSLGIKLGYYPNPATTPFAHAQGATLYTTTIASRNQAHDSCDTANSGFLLNMDECDSHSLPSAFELIELNLPSFTLAVELNEYFEAKGRYM